MRSKLTIPQIINWYAGLLIGVILLVIPLAYYLIASRSMEGSLESEAEVNAGIINQVISANPSFWQYEYYRFQDVLARRPRQGHREARRLLNAEGAVVAENSDEVPLPVMTRSARIYDSGSAVGTIEISRSLRPVLTQTGLLLLVMAPFAAGTFRLLRTLPLQVIRRTEDAYRRERDAAQRYLDVAGVMFVVLDRDRKVTLINRKGCEILGCTEDDVLGRDWFDQFVPPYLRAAAQDDYETMLLRGAGHTERFEEPVATRSGGERTILWHLIVLTDDHGEFAGTLRSGEDITERKQLEHQLRHANKLEAVGQLAGGVAHDFNNLLSAILGYGGMLHMNMREDDPLRHDVDQILAAAERAAYVTKSLLAFSRKQIINPRPQDINEIIARGEKLLRRLIGEDIEVRTRLAPGGVVVFADSVQIEQVLMNLATNARDAMPRGGVLTLETGRITADADFARIHELKRPGSYAVVTVSDTGSGMSPETLGKVFEPFFTTKEVGKGTGLGLANAYGSILQHNGSIQVTSEPGRGTTFRIYLPAVQTAADDFESTAPAAAPRGAETVLVAEDDGTVRSITRSILQKFGYTVIEAVDGEDAVRSFAQHRDAVDLVILDVIMPKKTGRAAHDEIAALRPGVKVLFTSGHTAEVIHAKGLLDERTPFLPKPATPAELLKKVREVLDR
jgi:PAS domain S-box-containing protein